MVDGVPVNDITNVLGGSFDFSTMSTDNVEQVEIVRGPLSAIDGSDAVAGVINIISCRGEGNRELHASGALGNFSSRELQVGASGNQWSRLVSRLAVEADHGSAAGPAALAGRRERQLETGPPLASADGYAVGGTALRFLSTYAK